MMIETELELGGAATKFINNLEATKLLKTLQQTGRPFGDISESERQTLLKYCGWGDTQVFNRMYPKSTYGGYATWGQPIDEVKELLTDEEINLLRGSSINAHYTAIGVIKAMWAGAEQLGIGAINCARYLEPACGVGHFFGTMPESLYTGGIKAAIDLEPIAAGITQYLYGDVKVFNQAFETFGKYGTDHTKTNTYSNYFDLVITNVPFADVNVHDPTIKDKHLKKNLHNYYIVNSINLTAPGGFIVVITSHYTMDATDKRTRQYISEQCVLHGAFRLPNDAFEKNAGTSVVTDILFLQKRFPGIVEGHVWIDTPEINLNKGLQYNNTYDRWQYQTPQYVNEYYRDNPQNVLGNHTTARGMYSSNEYTVTPIQGAVLEQQLMDAIKKTLPHDVIIVERQEIVGHIIECESNVEKKQFNDCVERLIDISKTARALIGTREAEESARLRTELSGLYDEFVIRYGLISTKKNQSELKGCGDIDVTCLAPFLKSLENNDGSKAAIFYEDTVRKVESVQQITEPRHAMLTCLDRFGRLDMDWICETTCKPIDDVLSALKGIVYVTPQRQYVTADEYLSGNILEKLNAARAAAVLDECFNYNVESLASVMPEPVGPGEIHVRLGANWIPEQYISDFVKELIPSYCGNVRFIPSIPEWIVTQEQSYYSIENTKTWGTSRKTALDLIEDALNVRNPTVYDVVEDEYGNRRSVPNSEETLLAQSKLQDIHDKFTEWIWQDAGRSELLVSIYNETYNVFREREYDGSHLTLPGISRYLPFTNNTVELAPYPHQLDAAWQGLQSKTMMLAHSVGSGKTASISITCAELLRLGLARKCAITVPNNIVEQWGEYVRQLYPGIPVMVADKVNFSPDKRAEFLSRIATSKNVIAIFTHTAWKMIPLKDETFIGYVDERIDALRKQLTEVQEQSKSGYRSRSRTSEIDKITSKRIEKKIKRLEVKLKNKQSDIKRDNANMMPCFEDLGIDVIVNDESHEHKNLGFESNMSNIAGLSMTESDRAFDMFIKTQYLLKTGGRVFFATATPIANTMAEIYTVMKYLQFDLLKKLGLETFDSWVKCFASVVSSIEMKVTGKWEVVQRLAKFFNLPELVHILRQVWNVKTKEQLKLNEPTVYGDKPIVIKVEDTGELNELLSWFAQRADDIKDKLVDPTQDNFLKITTDLRKAALDVRLVKPSLGENPGNKINKAVEQIVKVYRRYDEKRYTQLVFCDLSTPKSKINLDEEPSGEVLTEEELFIRDGVYYDIKRKLIRAGIPSEHVVFIHDYNTPARKEALFRQFNEGDVRIMILPTSKGVGMNVQKRLIALHYLTPPWRPTDIEQCDGRALRQGNEVISDRGLNEVLKFVYVTKACAFMWQLLEAKARFISQIMQGSVTIRAAEDVGDMILNAAQVKAIASGDPRIMKKVALDVESVKLDKLYTAWRNSRYSMLREEKTLPGFIESCQTELSEIKHAVSVRDKNTTDKFSIKLLKPTGSVEYDPFVERKDACIRINTLVNLAKSKIVSQKQVGMFDYQIGMYRGFNLHVRYNVSHTYTLSPPSIIITGDGCPQLKAGVMDSDIGTIQSVDYQLRSLDGNMQSIADSITRSTVRLQSIKVELGKPWDHMAKYRKVKRELAAINGELSGVEDIDGFEFTEDDVENYPDDATINTLQDNVFYQIDEPATVIELEPGVEKTIEACHPLEQQLVKRRPAKTNSNLQLCLSFLSTKRKH